MQRYHENSLGISIRIYFWNSMRVSMLRIYFCRFRTKSIYFVVSIRIYFYMLQRVAPWDFIALLYAPHHLQRAPLRISLDSSNLESGTPPRTSSDFLRFYTIWKGHHPLQDPSKGHPLGMSQGAPLRISMGPFRIQWTSCHFARGRLNIETPYAKSTF